MKDYRKDPTTPDSIKNLTDEQYAAFLRVMPLCKILQTKIEPYSKDDDKIMGQVLAMAINIYIIGFRDGRKPVI